MQCSRVTSENSLERPANGSAHASSYHPKYQMFSITPPALCLSPSTLPLSLLRMQMCAPWRGRAMSVCFYLCSFMCLQRPTNESVEQRLVCSFSIAACSCSGLQGTISGGHCAKDGVHLGQVTSSSWGCLKDKHSFTPLGKLILANYSNMYVFDQREDTNNPHMTKHHHYS